VLRASPTRQACPEQNDQIQDVAANLAILRARVSLIAEHPADAGPDQAPLIRKLPPGRTPDHLIIQPRPPYLTFLQSSTQTREQLDIHAD
jgi:hypothetical protein